MTPAPVASVALILPREQARLAAALAPYFAEIAPDLAIDPPTRAQQMLHRKDMTAFWIRDVSDIIGFALVLNLPEDRRELSEFTIFPDHRRRGLGQAAAHLLLQEFPGRWRMGISAHSPAALAFWGTALSTLAGVRALTEGAPFTDLQIKSFTFQIAGPPHD